VKGEDRLVRVGLGWWVLLVKGSAYQENTFCRRRQLSACWFRVVGLVGERVRISGKHILQEKTV